jgi:hypothetical protein
MSFKPDKFDSWDAETQVAVREVLSKHSYATAHGHGYVCYILIPNPDKTTGKPVGVSLGFEVTLPKAWTWEHCEPMLWRMAADFLKYQESTLKQEREKR